MAITINQEPSGYQSAHEEVWHVVTSDNILTPGFQYVFDIYRDGTLITRVKNTPYPITGEGVLDASAIVRSYVATDSMPDFDTNSFAPLSTLGLYEFWTEYVMAYGEVCGQTLYSNLTSGSHRVYNTYNRAKWDNVSSEVTGAMILSNRPSESYWYEGEPVVLTSFQTSGQYYVRNEKQGATVLNSKSYPQTTLETAAICSWVPNADNVTFELSGSVSGVVGTRTLKKKCGKYDKHTLVFLNAFGGYDSFTFVHGKMTADNEKKKFERQRWSIQNGEMSERAGLNIALDPNSIYSEGMKTYASKYKKKMQLTSDILNTAEYNWLAELIVSPLVYYFDTTNWLLYPVQITDTNYEFKDDLINKADNLVVNIDFSINNHTQFR